MEGGGLLLNRDLVMTDTQVLHIINLVLTLCGALVTYIPKRVLSRELHWSPGPPGQLNIMWAQSKVST